MINQRPKAFLSYLATFYLHVSDCFNFPGYEPPLRRSYPPVVEFARRHAFTAFILVVFLGTAIWIAVEWVKLAHETNVPKNSLGIPVDFIRLAKLLSVPLVCLLFTWFHVWLALQMMFFPIDSRAVQSIFEFSPLRPKSPPKTSYRVTAW